MNPDTPHVVNREAGKALALADGSAIIVTLYKGVFYDGLGAVVTLEAGDTLTRREPDDDSFELKRKGAYDERIDRRECCIQRLRERLRAMKEIAEDGLRYSAPGSASRSESGPASVDCNPTSADAKGVGGYIE